MAGERSGPDTTRERWIGGALAACAAVPVVTLAVLLVILGGGVVAPAPAGLSRLLAGSLLLASAAVAFACPIGLVIAVIASEWARPRRRATIAALLGHAAAVPAVLYGFVALELVAPALAGSGVAERSGLAAAVALAAMITPTFAAHATAAIRGVPEALRHAAYALGARRLSTTVQVVLPAARRGIASALLLALARALGEGVLVAIAAGSGRAAGLSLGGPVETLASWLVIEPSSAGALRISAALFVVAVVCSGVGRWLAREEAT